MCIVFLFNLIRRLIISNKRTRINRHIHASEVRLVDENDEQIGIVPIEEALEQAKMAGLDLVEVAPNARPPVVRIMDYGKYKYEMQKREKKAKKKQHSQQLKELQVRPRIFEHDLDIKIDKARKFFAKRYKVKFVIKYRGRELKHYDDGKELLAYIRESISDVAKPDHEPKFESRRITQIFSPAGNN